MTYDRYYYSMLSENDKFIYKRLYEGIEKFEKNISIKKTDITLQDLFQFIGLDNPHIFYVDFNHYNYIESFDDYVIQPIYWYTKIDAEKIDKKINKVIKKILDRITCTGEYWKEKAVHDLLIKNISYNYVAEKNITKFAPVSNSILGVLFYKTAVCEGISKITKLILNLLDIKCIVAVGFSKKENGPHAWNIVKINGQSYHLDLTWDINMSTHGICQYDYFNLTDGEINNDHIFNNKYPICNSKEENYFYKNKLIVKNITEIEKLMISQYPKGEKNVSFKFIETFPGDFERTVQKAVSLTSSIGCHIGINMVSYTINQEQKIATISF